MSSMRTINTFGRGRGTVTWNRGGGVAFRASRMVLCRDWGSAIGSTRRSVSPVFITPIGSGAAARIAGRRPLANSLAGGERGGVEEGRTDSLAWLHLGWDWCLASVARFGRLPTKTGSIMLTDHR